MIEVNSQIIFSPLHYISIAEHQNKVARQIRRKNNGENDHGAAHIDKTTQSLNKHTKQYF